MIQGFNYMGPKLQNENNKWLMFQSSIPQNVQELQTYLDKLNLCKIIK